MAEHAVGSKISLISKSEIRYEGLLDFINPTDNTVGLKNVHMCGTEGRKGDPKQEVPGSDTLYEFIVFRGNDIKDLTLYEDQTQAHVDPAIVSAKASANQPPKQAPKTAAAAPPAPQQVAGRGGKPGFYDTRNNTQQPRTFEPRANDTRFERGKEHRLGGDASHHHTLQPAAQQQQQQQQAPQGGRGGRGQGGYEVSSGRGTYGQVVRAGKPPVNNNTVQHHNDDRYRVNQVPQRGGRGGQAPNHVDHAHQGGRGGQGFRGGHDQHQGGRGGHDFHNNRGGRGGQHVHPNAGAAAAPHPHVPHTPQHTGQFTEGVDLKAKEEYKVEFDFAKAKVDFEAKITTPDPNHGAAVPIKKYDKTSSFFDTISCEATERLAKQQAGRDAARATAREERENQNKVDADTFGAQAVGAMRQTFRHRGGRGGYFRGGNNGGRGGYRGAGAGRGN